MHGKGPQNDSDLARALHLYFKVRLEAQAKAVGNGISPDAATMLRAWMWKRLNKDRLN